MTAAFTADAARALGGPDWLARRREIAVERLADVVWPTPSEEIWRYSRIDRLDLGRYTPFTAEELGTAGVPRPPRAGPGAPGGAPPPPATRSARRPRPPPP